MKTSSRFGGQNRTGLALRTKLQVGVSREPWEPFTR